MATAYRNLSTMLEAGLGIFRAFSLSSRNMGPRIRRAFGDVEHDVGQGTSLSQAMARHPRVFRPIDVKLVEAGELSGHLAQCFAELGQWYDLRSRMRSNVINGLAMPLLVLHAAALIAPLPSLFLGSGGLSDYALSIAGILAVFYVPALLISAVIKLTPETGAARAVLDRVALSVPILGSALRHLAYARYFRVLGLLLRSGVPIRGAADSAQQLCSNAVVRRHLAGSVESVREGSTLSSGMGRSVPTEYVDAVAVAEETGTVDQACDKLAQVAQDRAERRLMGLSVWLPRVAYVLIMLLLAYQVVTNALLVIRKIGLAT
jgi:type II secretory pathway component PulF